MIGETTRTGHLTAAALIEALDTSSVDDAVILLKDLNRAELAAVAVSAAQTAGWLTKLLPFTTHSLAGVIRVDILNQEAS